MDAHTRSLDGSGVSGAGDPRIQRDESQDRETLDRLAGYRDPLAASAGEVIIVTVIVTVNVTVIGILPTLAAKRLGPFTSISGMTSGATKLPTSRARCRTLFGDALPAFLDESRVLFERDMLGTPTIQGNFEA